MKVIVFLMLELSLVNFGGNEAMKSSSNLPSVPKLRLTPLTLKLRVEKTMERSRRPRGRRNKKEGVKQILGSNFSLVSVSGRLHLVPFCGMTL
jgi:hypothetical protein